MSPNGNHTSMKINGAAGACEPENYKSDSSEVEQGAHGCRDTNTKTSECCVARKEKC